MSSRSTYQHQKFDFDDQEIFTVNDFAGVNYNIAELNSPDRNAVDIKNMVYEDGVVQSRKGWQTVIQVPVVGYKITADGGQINNPNNINGIWKFVAEDGLTYTVIHAGKLLFISKTIGKDYNYLNVSLKPLLTYYSASSTSKEKPLAVLNDMKTYGFVNGGCLYILGGTGFYILRIRSTATEGVESLRLSTNSYVTIQTVSELAYIPTVRIGVTCEGSSVSSAAALDDVSLLTQWRKEKLVSGTTVDLSDFSEQTYRYKLGSSIKAQNITDLNNLFVKISYLEEE